MHKVIRLYILLFTLRSTCSIANDSWTLGLGNSPTPKGSYWWCDRPKNSVLGKQKDPGLWPGSSRLYRRLVGRLGGELWGTNPRYCSSNQGARPLVSPTGLLDMQQTAADRRNMPVSFWPKSRRQKESSMYIMSCILSVVNMKIKIATMRPSTPWRWYHQQVLPDMSRHPWLPS